MAFGAPENNVVATSDIAHASHIKPRLWLTLNHGAAWGVYVEGMVKILYFHQLALLFQNRYQVFAVSGLRTVVVCNCHWITRRLFSLRALVGEIRALSGGIHHFSILISGKSFSTGSQPRVSHAPVPSSTSVSVQNVRLWLVTMTARGEPMTE